MIAFLEFFLQLKNHYLVDSAIQPSYNRPQSTKLLFPFISHVTMNVFNLCQLIKTWNQTLFIPHLLFKAYHLGTFYEENSFSLFVSFRVSIDIFGRYFITWRTNLVRPWVFPNNYSIIILKPLLLQCKLGNLYLIKCKAKNSYTIPTFIN